MQGCRWVSGDLGQRDRRDKGGEAPHLLPRFKGQLGVATVPGATVRALLHSDSTALGDGAE